MASSMPRQERHRHALQLPDNKSVRWLTERRFDGGLAHIPQFRHLVEAGAADDSDTYLFHIHDAEARV
jgi:hypothetical protein